MKEFLLGILIGFTLLVGTLWVQSRFDLTLRMYEDGSGKITWCMPGGLCQD